MDFLSDINYVLNWTNLLSQKLIYKDENYKATIQKAIAENPWFTQQSIEQMLESICIEYLNQDKLNKGLLAYQHHTPVNPKTIAVISAGNIPLVSFHDILAVLACGHSLQIKLSEKDTVLYQWLFGLIKEIDLRLFNKIEVVDRITNFDAIIATGGESASMIFTEYFGKYPNIIRGHRNGISILNGNESEDDFNLLAQDVFSYFGLGCRNVSKLFVPQNYIFDTLIGIFDKYYSSVQDHTKYRNNYDFQLANLLLNKQNFLQGSTILLIPSNNISSPIGTLYYEFYDDISELKKSLLKQQNKIQCIVGNFKDEELQIIPFGDSQKPGLTSYADNKDSLEFLLNLELN